MRQMFAKDVPLCLIKADFLCRQLSPFMFRCRLLRWHILHNLRWHVQHILHILHILHVLHLLCTCFICFIPCLCYSATIQRVQYKSYTVSLHKHGVIEIVEMNIYGTNCEGEMTCKSCIRGWDQRVPAQWAAMNPTVQYQQQIQTEHCKRRDADCMQGSLASVWGAGRVKGRGG